ncbi:MAG: hypothetical protein JZU65_17725, partial [Chlorobium sp.]|nr:hypothetical protein [Chlorobium sp.]
MGSFSDCIEGFPQGFKDAHYQELKAGVANAGALDDLDILFIEGRIKGLVEERRIVVAKILRERPELMVALKDSHGKTTEAKKPSYGSQNKLVSSDRAAELRAKLREKLSNLNSGIDPEMLAIGTELAAYHIEAGARSFADFASAIFADLADLAPKASPYIKTWYMGAKMLPGMDKTGMDSEATVNSLDENDFIGSYEETVDTFDANPDTDIKELNLTDGGNKDERGGIAGTGEASLGEVVSTDGEGNEGEGLLRPLDAGGSEKGGLPDKPVDESGVSTARSGRGSSKGRNPDTTRKPGRKGGVAEEPA